MAQINATVILSGVSDADMIAILQARDGNPAIAVNQVQLGQVGQKPGFQSVTLHTGSAQGLTALAELVAKLK